MLEAVRSGQQQRSARAPGGGLAAGGRHGFRYVDGGTKAGSVVGVHKPGVPETILRVATITPIGFAEPLTLRC